MISSNKDMIKLETSRNARKSQWRYRGKDKRYTSRRGTKKYFLYLQERFLDLYCCVIYSVVFPIPQDNFTQNDLITTSKSLDEIKRQIFFFSLKKGKKVNFSTNSIKL